MISYKELKTQYGLPEFDDMDFIFMISDIEETNYPLKAICEKMQEVFMENRDALSDVLSPDSHSASMYECNYLTDEDKTKAFMIYREFMSVIRTIDMVLLENNLQNHASAINHSFKIWTENKSELAKIYARLVESWKVEISKEERENYMG
jgi:hypothetical protein